MGRVFFMCGPAGSPGRLLDEGEGVAEVGQPPPALPCFSTERVSYDRDGRVVESDHSLYRSDRYDILMRVRRGHFAPKA